MRWWHDLSVRTQRWAMVAAVAVAVLVIVGGLNSIGAAPSGPSLSSYATTDGGLAAFDSLLDANGYDTRQLRVPLDDADLDPGATVVALGQTLSTGEASSLRGFVERGGRVVTGGPEAETFLRTFVPALRWRADGQRRLQPAPSDTVAGLRTVVADGFGGWTESPGRALFAGAGVDSGFVLRVGAGTIVALADPSPLTNQRLGQADNAGFALAVIGASTQPVLFAEAGHGYGLASGLGALPPRWKAALWFGAVAALVAALAAGKRLGPVDPEPQPTAPQRSEYVSAVASTLARTRDRDGAAAPLRARGTALLFRRAGTSPDGTDDLVAAARRAGLSADEIRSLTEPVATDDDLVALGRTVSRIEER